MAREKPDWGPAVKDGLVRYTSVSALTSFDPLSYGGCNRRWYFKYVEKREEPTTKAQQAGTDLHEQVEHYLTHGEDVLGPIARAGKHLLPRPGSDLLVEKDFGDPKAAIALREAGGPADQVAALAGLSAGGIPLVGFIDIRHKRGEYVDQLGELRREEGRVVETIDNKSTSDLKYVKTAADLVEAIQMIGYANTSYVMMENADFARLSHITFQTRGAKAALKTTVLLPVDEARRKWERVHGLARTMIDVARAARSVDVDVNLRSCSAYRTGCPHQRYCDRPNMTITDLFQIRPGDKNMSESLFSKLPGDTNGVAASAQPQSSPPPPSSPVQSLFSAQSPAPPAEPVGPISDAERAARRQAELERLAVAERAAAAPPPPPVRLEGIEGYRPGQPCNGHGYYVSANGQGFLVVEAGHSCPACARPAQTHVGAVNPPDQPSIDPVAAAVPLSPEARAQIADPTLRAIAEEHARAAALRAASEAGAAEATKASGRCSGGGKQVVMDDRQKMTRSMTCADCGKNWKKVPDKDITIDQRGVLWNVPKHNLPAAQPQASPPPPPAQPVAAAPPPPPPPAQPAAQPQHLQAPAAPAPAPIVSPAPPSAVAPQHGIVLYVDVIFERGQQPLLLDDYISDVVSSLQKKAGLSDLRYTPEKHDLAFSRWKGALAACVRYEPPKPGTYVVRNFASSEITQVVVEALVPLCQTVVRGVR